jgi:electron transfer flavoprotein alpha subunit
MSVLVYVEHEHGQLKAETAKVISAASQLKQPMTALVVGHQVGDVAEQVARLSGVERVLVADNSVYAHQLAENTAALIVALAADYQHIYTAATTTAKNTLPRVAALLDVPQVSDVISIHGDNTYTRPIYAGNALATVVNQAAVQVVTVRATAFEPMHESDELAAIIACDEVFENQYSTFVDAQMTVSERPELTAADVVISGGRGMQNGENFALLEGIADKLNAAIGASRAAVDAGFVPNDMQVGQTGKIVAPSLYIAVGISGAIQHLAGMKDSKIIVAINKDEDAPIFQVADYGLVGDLFTLLPELQAKL